MEGKYKMFILDDVISGVVRSEYDIKIGFDKDARSVELIAYNEKTEIPFTELEEYAKTLNALVRALKGDIGSAIEDEQDGSLPDFCGDDTDHIPNGGIS